MFNLFNHHGIRCRHVVAFPVREMQQFESVVGVSPKITPPPSKIIMIIDLCGFHNRLASTNKTHA